MSDRDAFRVVSKPAVLKNITASFSNPYLKKNRVNCFNSSRLKPDNSLIQ